MASNNLNNTISHTIEVSIRLLFLFLLIAWCISLLLPFLTPVLWAVIIAVSVDPLFDWLNKKLGNRPAWASGIVTLLLLAVILVPAGMVFTRVAEDVYRFGTHLSSETFQVPPPNESVRSWPVVGEKIYGLWEETYRNPEKTIATYDNQIKAAGKWLLQSAMAITGDLFKLLMAIIIAGVLLATPGTEKFAHKFFIKMVGSRGEEFASLAEKTIRNVTKGILGVAIIQSSIMGIIFFLAGVPFAGVLMFLCLMLGIMQLPSLPISIGAVVWLFSNGETSSTMAVVWAVLLLLASLSDNVLKPILLGKGAPVPMLVIFLGAIGGFMMSGFLGLFTGAIVLSLGYKLFISWINDENTTAGNAA